MGTGVSVPIKIPLNVDSCYMPFNNFVFPYANSVSVKRIPELEKYTL